MLETRARTPAAQTQRVRLRVPTPLRSLAGNQATVEVEAPTDGSGPVSVWAVLAALASTYPGVHDAVLDECGAVRPHVNVFVGTESIRVLGGLRAPLPEGSTVTIVPAVSGG